MAPRNALIRLTGPNAPAGADLRGHLMRKNGFSCNEASTSQAVAPVCSEAK